MKKQTIYVFALLLTASSCSSDNATSKEPKIAYQVAFDINHDITTYFFLGEEVKYELEEAKADRSEPQNLQQKIKLLNDCLSEIERNLSKPLISIEKMKIAVLKSAGANKAIEKDHIYAGEFYPMNYDLTVLKDKTNAVGKIDPLKKQELIEQLYDMRTEVCKLFVESSGNSEHKYSFNDPQIKISELDKLDHFREFNEKNSNISLDDKEALYKIYAEITFSIVNVERNITESDNILNAFSNLVNIQKQLLIARSDLFHMLKSRVGGRNYMITDFEPIVTGPVVVKKGETIKLNVKFGAYDSYHQPVVNTNGAILESTANGSSELTFKGDKPGLKKITGTITIFNKSGVPITMPWSREVYVTE